MLKNELLEEICDNLNSKQIKDMSQSIIGKPSALSMESGFIKMLSWLPEDNLVTVCRECSVISKGISVATVYSTFSKLGVLNFTPYVIDDVYFGKVLVCGINRFVVYDSGYIKVLTDLSVRGILSVSKGDLHYILEVMRNSLSVDGYNAIVATLISTAYMCSNLRDCIRNGDTCITEFLAYIVKDCRAFPIYSVETFKSKLTWMDKSKSSNLNVEVTKDEQTYYLVSVGNDASTVYYNTDLDTVGFVSVMYNDTILHKYNAQYNHDCIYFAHALCLLVVDIFHNPFPCLIGNGYLYKPIQDINKLYEV